MAEPPAPLRVGVVGTGEMGRRHVRILSRLAGAELVGVLDIRPEVAREVAGAFETRVFSSLEELGAEVDAAVVAVPTADHARVGADLLHRGVHLLVEKPIASSLAEADELCAAADDRVLAVGHVEFFNPAVQALLERGARPGFLEVHRLAAFTPRSLDIDVVLDLMIHDLQILHALDPSPIREIRAKGINVLTSRIDIANVRIALESGCVANLTASRVSAETVRKLRAFLPQRYYSVDYRKQEIKGFRLEAGGTVPKLVREAPPVAPADSLELELVAFLEACRGQQARLVDGAAGRRALSTALEVAKSIAESD